MAQILSTPERATSVILAAMLFAGCGGPRLPERKACVPVRGTLLVRSRPAAGAMVYFRPVDGSRAEDWGSGFPRGRVDANGTFIVTTNTPGDGAPPGEYRLLIEWLSPAVVIAEDDEAEGEADVLSHAEDRFGGRYLDPATTPLRARVNEEATELPPIDLK